MAPVQIGLQRTPGLFDQSTQAPEDQGRRHISFQEAIRIGGSVGGAFEDVADAHYIHQSGGFHQGQGGVCQHGHRHPEQLGQDDVPEGLESGHAYGVTRFKLSLGNGQQAAAHHFGQTGQGHDDQSDDSNVDQVHIPDGDIQME